MFAQAPSSIAGRAGAGRLGTRTSSPGSALSNPGAGAAILGVFSDVWLEP